MTTRRELLIALGAGALVARRPAYAQPARVFHIGWLAYGRSMVGAQALDALRAGLRDLGYVEGRNLSLIERWSEPSSEDADRMALELVRLNPDVIVTTSAAVLSVMRTGATTPVVFAFSGDPVVAKIVDNVARPGRNYTGMSFLSLELAAKRIELIKEVLPGLKRAGVIANPQHPGRQAELSAALEAATKLGIAVDYFEARTLPELDAGLAAIAKARCEAIVVFPDARTMSFTEQIAGFSLKNRMPAISGWTYFAENGNLMSYGPQFDVSFRHLATYIDKILRGAKPADLPVELPTVFELVINMKTAKTLGIKIPNSVLGRANRLVE